MNEEYTQELIDKIIKKYNDEGLSDHQIKASINYLVELAESEKSFDGLGYFEIIKYITEIFPKNLVEQLWQLVNGPVFDGDIISKNDRGELFEMGIAIRVCKDGEQGYTGSKYIGYSVLKELGELDYGK